MYITICRNQPLFFSLKWSFHASMRMPALLPVMSIQLWELHLQVPSVIAVGQEASTEHQGRFQVLQQQLRCLHHPSNRHRTGTGGHLTTSAGSPPNDLLDMATLLKKLILCTSQKFCYHFGRISTSHCIEWQQHQLCLWNASKSLVEVKLDSIQ